MQEKTSVETEVVHLRKYLIGSQNNNTGITSIFLEHCYTVNDPLTIHELPMSRDKIFFSVNARNCFTEKDLFVGAGNCFLSFL